MHRTTVDSYLLEGCSELLDLHLAATEHDDTLQVSVFEDILDDGHLLSFVANVSFLLDFLGRFADSELDFHWIFEKGLGQVLDLVGHGSREHDGLASLRKFLGDGHDVLGETHVEHTVCLVKNEEAHLAQVDVAQTDVGDEATWGSDDYIGTHAQAFELLIIAVAIVAAINGHAAHSFQVIAETLHGLVYLLCKFAGRRHNHAVDGILRIASVIELAEDRQEVGGSLAGTRLCYS